MNLKLVSTTQDDSTGTYTDIEIRATENSKSKTIHLKSTAELNRLVDTYPNAKLSNFTVNPFTIRSNTVRSIRIIKDNNKQAVRNTTTATLSPDIYNKINMLNDNVNKLLNNQLIQIDGLRKLPTTINNTLPQVINNNLPQVTQDGIEQKLARIEDILNTLSDMLLDNEIKEDDILNEIRASNDKIYKHIDDIIEAINPMYDTIRKEFDEQHIKDKSYTFPKCNSDINRWRYGGIDSKAFDFNYTTNENGTITISDTRFSKDSVLDAFNNINNAESYINIQFNANIIIAAKEFLQMYDECRQITEAAYNMDSNSSLDDKDDAAMAASLSILGTASASALFQQFKVLETEAIAAGQPIVLGTTAVLVTMLIQLTKVGIGLTKTTLDSAGVTDINLKNRGIITKNSKISTIITKETDEYKTQDVKHESISVNTSPENFKNLITFNCRVFTVDKMKAITQKPSVDSKKEKILNRQDKNKEYYKYIKYTMCRCPVTEDKLFLFYIKYYLQPTLGFRFNGKKVNRIGANDVEVRKQMFNCFQNAYFASCILLLTDSTLDHNVGEDRLEWLTTCDAMGSINLHEAGPTTEIDVYIIKFMKYMKLCLCIQGLSPICADLLIDMFCKYGHINYKVLDRQAINNDEFRMDM